MFDNDNHSSGVALDKYKKLNGKKGVFAALKTSESYGLASDDSHLLADRISTYGTNAARPVKIKSLCQLIKEQLDDTTMKILIAATFVSLAIGIWRDVTSHLKKERIVNFGSITCRSTNAWRESAFC